MRCQVLIRDDGFFTIAVRNGKQYVAKYPTEGYLIDAFWSPDGRYVAVDNRRANSGDYLWVFRLRDGHAIKMPVDAQPQHDDDVCEKSKMGSELTIATL